MHVSECDEDAFGVGDDEGSGDVFFVRVVGFEGARERFRHVFHYEIEVNVLGAGDRTSLI